MLFLSDLHLRAAQMKRKVDGFDLNCLAKRSWKVERSQYGRRIDQIPVTWTTGEPAQNSKLEVWFPDPAELERRAADPRPFVVALATAERESVLPPQTRDFVGLFEVVATGALLSGISLETEVRRRVRAY